MKKNKTDVRKILRTTDGNLENKSHIKKPRNVAVIEQRKDKAIGVVKIYSKEGKNNNATIKNVVLKPKKNRSSITEDSIVGSRIYIGRKTDDGYEPFYTSNFRDTNEKLSFYEYLMIKGNIQNDSKKHRKTYKEKVKKWKNHFRK